MRPTAKVLFLTMVVFLFSFPPLFASEPSFESVPQGGEREFWSDTWSEQNSSPYCEFPGAGRGQLFHGPGKIFPNFIKRQAMSILVPKTFNSFIDDFLANDDIGGECYQFAPAITQSRSGNFVIAWTDERNGYRDIYAQRYDSFGTPLGTNFRVNDDAGTADQWYPALSMDASGNFVITWSDRRDGSYSDLYAQRFDSIGTPLGSNFKVTGTGYISAVALDALGNFIISWTDDRNSNYDIYAQRYNSSGTPLGTNFKVTDDPGTFYQQTPTIAMDGSGNFVITWEDWRNNSNNQNYDIYAQRYNSSGIPLGSNFKVNDDLGTHEQHSANCAMDDLGNFVIAWLDYRNVSANSNYDIYAQRYNSSGIPLGTNFKANDDVGTTHQYYPAIVMNGYGTFVITWRDGRNSTYDIYAQRYSSSGTALGSNLRVNDSTGTLWSNEPRVAIDSSGNFVITWSQNYLNFSYDVYAQRFDSSGTPLGSNFRVHDDIGASNQRYPAIALSASGNFVLAWHDYRNSDYDIYVQEYNSSFATIGFNYKVSDDTGSTTQDWPVLDMDSLGNFVIAWRDYRNQYRLGDIYAQRVDYSGTSLGPNFKVTDDTVKNNNQTNPDLAMDKVGNFVITWTDVRGPYSADIYAQRYDSAGNPLDSNFRVNDDTGKIGQYSPAIAMDRSGNFIITWRDTRSGKYEIRAQRYNSLGDTLGPNFKVNDDTGTTIYLWPPPAISLDGSGNFVIAWEDARNGMSDIYAQRYDSSGTPLGTNFKVNDAIQTASQLYPAMAMDYSGNFVITWCDYRNAWYDPDIYAQIYDASGTPVGVNHLVPNPQYASFAQEGPAVAANSSNIYFTWMDNRRGKGWDIYAKVVDWGWNDVEDDKEVNLPKSFELSQNYPNPFNPSTTIEFKVLSSGLGQLTYTTLKIYNITGQLVRILVDEEKAPGNYRISWDGRDDLGREVASGIYFYRIKAGDFIRSKKMVILK